MTPTEILRADLPLRAEQLDDKYNYDGDGEHPLFPRKYWREAVQQECTLFGYWAWVEMRVWEEATSTATTH